MHGKVSYEALPEVGISRRSLCIGAGSLAVLAGLGCLKVAGSDPALRPPGGQDEAELVGACIRCQKCFEVCPRGVIVPSHVEDGLLTMRTPTMNFHSNWCDWCKEENGGEPLCVKCCPTGALKLPAGAVPETTIIGRADLQKDLCLAQRLTGCKFCYDACPYKAIELDEMGRPYVIADLCNGCGACESVCVSLENGSIGGRSARRAIIVKPVEG